MGMGMGGMGMGMPGMGMGMGMPGMGMGMGMPGSTFAKSLQFDTGMTLAVACRGGRLHDHTFCCNIQGMSPFGMQQLGTI